MLPNNESTTYQHSAHLTLFTSIHWLCNVVRYLINSCRQYLRSHRRHPNVVQYFINIASLYWLWFHHPLCHNCNVHKSFLFPSFTSLTWQCGWFLLLRTFTIYYITKARAVKMIKVLTFIRNWTSSHIGIISNQVHTLLYAYLKM